MNYKKEDYNRFIDLFMKNEPLQTKEENIECLINSCKNTDEKELVFYLLEKLVFLDSDKYNLLLNHMVEYIEDLNLDYSNTQFAATAMDDEADSSQSVLQALKHKLSKKNINDFITVNNFNKTIQYYHKGKTNIVVVDEFVGSGQTVLNRIKMFKERISFYKDYNFHFVFLAGMEYSINLIKAQNINIFCAYPLKRGISDNFAGDNLNKVTSTMLELELRLAQKINEKELYDYSFGYGSAEALYTAEECLSNTPNSVFPLFWWKKDIDNNERQTILTRHETGF